MSLPSLVQLVCNEGREGRLAVTAGGRTAEVYFAGGNVVHATVEGLAGEEAFTKLAAWSDGDFELAYDVAAPERTVQKNWSSLLLAALHSLDEENEARSEYYNIILGNLVTVGGINEVLITRADGEVHACNASRPVTAEGLLAALVCAVAPEVGEKLGLGAFTQFVLYGEGRPLVIFGYEEECYEFTLANGADPENVGTAVRRLLKMMV